MQWYSFPLSSHFTGHGSLNYTLQNPLKIPHFKIIFLSPFLMSVLQKKKKKKTASHLHNALGDCEDVMEFTRAVEYFVGGIN